MNKLISALQRLYFLPGQQWCAPQMDDRGNLIYSAEGALTTETVAQCLAGGTGVALSLVSPDGRVRAMAVDFDRAADWGQAASLYLALQDELDLPAPAVSVSGQKGYRLWLSLAEPISGALARDFLRALGGKYLADMPVADFRLHPDTNKKAFVEPAAIMLVPALHLVSGKWSAFIDPGLVGMFSDEPWLEMAPNMERQADMLAGLKSIESGAFQRALSMLQGQTKADASPAFVVQSPAVCGESASLVVAEHAGSGLKVGNTFSEPVSFLLAVMNDSSLSTEQRIEAAKALLPYLAHVRPR